MKMAPITSLVVLAFSAFSVIHGISTNELSLQTILSEVKILQERLQSFERVIAGQNSQISELKHTVNRLEGIVHTQNRRIMDLESTVVGQNRQIKYLEGINRVSQFSEPDQSLVNPGHYIEVEEGIQGSDSLAEKIESHDNEVEERTQSFVRRERLVGSPTEDIIAFYAILSKSESSPSVHHTIIFDNVKTNVGNGYNHVTGVFTAPRDGVYVFVWVIRLYISEHSTELIIENAVYGATFLRAKATGAEDAMVTGTVVAEVSKGQSVFVRIHSSYAGDGLILSNEHGQPTFSGWLLR